MSDGFDRLEDRSGDWTDRQAGKLADHPKGTILKWFLGLVALVIVLGVFFSAIGFIGDWGSSAKKIVSPANVETQYQAVIDDWQALKAAAQNACDAKTSKTDENSPTFLGGDPSLAYAQTYRRVVVDYNRRQHNLFEAKLVGPKGYPRTIPVTSPDWCRANSELEAVHD